MQIVKIKAILRYACLTNRWNYSIASVRSVNTSYFTDTVVFDVVSYLLQKLSVVVCCLFVVRYHQSNSAGLLRGSQKSLTSNKEGPSASSIWIQANCKLVPFDIMSVLSNYSKFIGTINYHDSHVRLRV